jgi:hypothetical protein
MKPINTKLFFLLVPLVLACFALSPPAQAVVPPPDGGYLNFNTAEGQKALFSLTTGAANTAVGWFSLFSNATGEFNTAVGAGTLLFNTAGENTATGTGALLNNTAGDENTANGAFALFSNTEGSLNTAVGGSALFSNTTGSLNTAIGDQALFNNTEGSQNTATGHQALSNNSTGANTAMGDGALFSNTIGGANTAVGTHALLNNTTEGFNTATGVDALFNNTTGAANTANGYQALFTNGIGIGNTAIGDQALFNNATGNFNTSLGTQAGTGVTTADNVICVGHNGQNVSNSCFIGNIRGVTTAQPDAIPVMIDSLGQLGTTSSSRRFKKEIQPIDKISESILALKPVTFHYKSDLAGAGPQFGLIAEEVAEVNPDLVVRDKNGEIYTVRYDAVNAMLLNEFLKEHRKVEEQKATISKLESTVAQHQKRFESRLVEQDKRIATLASGLQKLSAQIVASKPASEMAANNH